MTGDNLMEVEALTEFGRSRTLAPVPTAMSQAGLGKVVVATGRATAATISRAAIAAVCPAVPLGLSLGW